MQKLAFFMGVCLLGLAGAQSASAEFVVWPGRPIVRPLRPVPVYPVYPVNPVNVAIPSSDLDWRDMGAVPFVGNQLRTESIDLGHVQASYVSFRLPAACALKIQTLTLNGERAPVRFPTDLSRSYSNGYYTYFTYASNYGDDSLTNVTLSIWSNAYYYASQGCGIRVFVARGNNPTPYYVK